MESERALRDAIAKAAAAVESSDGRALVVSHYDADGLAAASILLKTLSKRGFAVHLLIQEQLTPASLSRLERLWESYPFTIIADMGSGTLPHLAKARSKLVVLDHHTPGEGAGGVVEVNPPRFGIDGSREVSSAGLAYLLARELEGEGAVQLAPLAVVGALGDRQDVGRHFKLTGLNAKIVREAVEAKLLEERIDIRIFGGWSRPLLKALVYTTDPFLPGITGEEGGALAFLKSIGVEPVEGERARTLNNLSREERRKLASALVKLLLGAGYSIGEAERVYGAMYVIKSEPEDSPLSDAREYASLLNANGRMGFYELAVALGLGARGNALLRAVEVASRYRATLAKAFQVVREERPVREGRGYTLIDLRGSDFLNERMSGALASLLTPYARRNNLLLVALDSPEGVKVSARRPEGFRIHAGIAMAKAAQRVGGLGGGHEAAGGATIPAGKLEEFLREVEALTSSAQA